MGEQTLRELILDRDGISSSEFEDMLEDFEIMVAGGEEPEEALLEVFSIEPDFLMDAEIWAAIERGFSRRPAREAHG